MVGPRPSYFTAVPACIPIVGSMVPSVNNPPSVGWQTVDVANRLSTMIVSVAVTDRNEVGPRLSLPARAPWDTPEQPEESMSTVQKSRKPTKPMAPPAWAEGGRLHPEEVEAEGQREAAQFVTPSGHSAFLAGWYRTAYAQLYRHALELRQQLDRAEMKFDRLAKSVEASR